jgi:CubicO group peptidase (beta-lactamase class C family)
MKAAYALVVAVWLLLGALGAQAASGCSGFVNPQRLYPSNRAEPSATPSLMQQGAALPNVSYVPIGQSTSRTLNEYLEMFCVTGLLVLHKGEIVFERYQQGVRPTDALLSASMSKSILALLAGIAIAEGKLRMDETVQAILPEFANSAFADTTVEELLRMTSGVALQNSYARGASADNQATNPAISPNQDVSRFLQGKRAANPAGKVFDYNGAVSAMLGAVLRARTGQTHTQYLQEKLWAPMGAAEPAYWIKNRRGEEGVQGQFAATLRDYARLGQLVMQMGRSGAFQVVPESWIADMVASRPDKPQPNGPMKYGLHIWIPQAAGGRSMFLGLNGQAIFIDPAAQTVIVHTANSPGPDYNGYEHLYPLRDAIVRSLRRDSGRARTSNN